MKYVSLLILCLALNASCWGEETEGSRLKLLYFTASWCGPCQMMKQQTWPNPIVQDALKPFDFQSIDVDAEKEVARSWSVRSMPTYLVVDPNRQIELARMSGFMDSQRMALWLRNVEKKARESLQSIIEKQEVAQKHWANLDLLEKDSPPPTTLKTGQEALYALLRDRGNLPKPDSQKVNQRLREIAAKHPEHIVSGLLHPDLQVRASISRALEVANIHIDPWAEKQVREREVNRLIQLD